MFRFGGRRDWPYFARRRVGYDRSGLPLSPFRLGVIPCSGRETYGRVRPLAKPSRPGFFPACCAGSSRPLRSKKPVRSGPPLALRPCGFEGPEPAHERSAIAGEMVPAT
jgi:hypothetical protein